jgi:dihydrofolate reductase
MAGPLISLVVAASENGVIGAHNTMPWRLPSELRRFKRLTMGHPVVMGRRTYEDINRPLPGRDTIVVTTGEVIDNPNVHTVNSIEEALALAARFAATRKVDEIMVIGGAQIYEQVRPRADRVYFTRVHMQVEGDTVFPDLNPQRWQETSREEVKATGEDSADYTFSVYDRIRPAT